MSGDDPRITAPEDRHEPRHGGPVTGWPRSPFAFGVRFVLALCVLVLASEVLDVLAYDDPTGPTAFVTGVAAGTGSRLAWIAVTLGAIVGVLAAVRTPRPRSRAVLRAALGVAVGVLVLGGALSGIGELLARRESPGRPVPWVIGLLIVALALGGGATLFVLRAFDPTAGAGAGVVVVSDIDPNTFLWDWEAAHFPGMLGALLVGVVAGTVGDRARWLGGIVAGAGYLGIFGSSLLVARWMDPTDPLVGAGMFDLVGLAVGTAQVVVLAVGVAYAIDRMDRPGRSLFLPSDSSDDGDSPGPTTRIATPGRTLAFFCGFVLVVGTGAALDIVFLRWTWELAETSLYQVSFSLTLHGPAIAALAGVAYVLVEGGRPVRAGATSLVGATAGYLLAVELVLLATAVFDPGVIELRTFKTVVPAIGVAVAAAAAGYLTAFAVGEGDPTGTIYPW